MFGLLLTLGGFLFLTMAVVHFYDISKIARREARVVTSADLRRTEDPKSLAGEWIAYTFEELKPTGLTVTRRRLGLGGDVEARCLLVRVEEKWLLASVAFRIANGSMIEKAKCVLPPACRYAVPFGQSCLVRAAAGLSRLKVGGRSRQP
jgi:hypothetical protein